MMNYTEQIDRYFWGDLVGDELVEFEKRLAVDVSFAAEVAEYKRLHLIMRESFNKSEFIKGEQTGSADKNLPDLDDLSTEMQENIQKEINEMLQDNARLTKDADYHKKLEDILKENETDTNDDSEVKTSGHEKSSGIWLKVAAVVFVIIIGSLTFLLLKSQNYTNEDLFTEYYKPDKRNLCYRLENNEKDTLSLAFQSYLKHDYLNAILLFNLASQEHNSTPSISLYKGLSYIETNRLPEAVRSFDVIVKQTNHDLFRDAQWYQALCYLKLEDNRKAMELFSDLVSSGGIYSKESREIVDKLNW